MSGIEVVVAIGGIVSGFSAGVKLYQTWHAAHEKKKKQKIEHANKKIIDAAQKKKKKKNQLEDGNKNTSDATEKKKPQLEDANKKTSGAKKKSQQPEHANEKKSDAPPKKKKNQQPEDANKKTSDAPQKNKNQQSEEANKKTSDAPQKKKNQQPEEANKKKNDAPQEKKSQQREGANKKTSDASQKKNQKLEDANKKTTDAPQKKKAQQLDDANKKTTDAPQKKKKQLLEDANNKTGAHENKKNPDSNVAKKDKSKKEKLESENDHLNKIATVIDKAGPLVQVKYDKAFAVVGKRFAAGDDITREQLKAQLVTLKQFITSLQAAVLGNGKLNLTELTNSASNVRDASLQSLSDQYQRMAVAAPIKASPVKHPMLSLPAAPSAHTKEKGSPSPKHLELCPGASHKSTEETKQTCGKCMYTYPHDAFPDAILRTHGETHYSFQLTDVFFFESHLPVSSPHLEKRWVCVVCIMAGQKKPPTFSTENDGGGAREYRDHISNGHTMEQYNKWIKEKGK